VSGLHLGENAQPGPGVIRSLRDALGDQVEIVGLAYDALDSALYMPGLLDDAFLLPYPSAGPETVFDRIAEIHAVRGLDVLIPCLDVELPVMQKLERRLRALGIAVALPTPGALARRTKDQLPALARQVGIAVPETVPILDRASLASAAARFGYPIVVKGIFYEAEVCNGPAEANAAFDKLSARWGLPLIAQQFVKGDEYDVIALGDGTGETYGAVAMRKTIVTRLGQVTIEDEDLIDVARRVIRGLAWRGGCEMELLRGAKDGKLYLIEVNPRFPAWVYLATAAGSNLPLALVHLARGEPLPEVNGYRIGVSMVRHAVEAIGDLSDMEALLSQGRTRRRTAA
jgi:carbamoyl-phosphate synthase large subunit